MPVHLFGQMADMDAIADIAGRHGIPVIEDAAQAIGAESHGRRAGSIGSMGCFSFFPSKNLGGFGDGGMVTTDREELAQRLRHLRVHGAKNKYFNEVVGGNFRLDALQAAVLRVKLKHLDRWTEGRQRNAQIYCRLFEGAGSVVAPVEPPNSRHIYNQFVLRCANRDGLLAHLKNEGIGAEVYYPVPLHMQTCFAELGYRKGDFPVSEQAAAECLAIPVYPELTEGMLKQVADTILEFY
jgi:dTDP-4-amino-4,6-dideoxygalactose transaminase